MSYTILSNTMDLSQRLFSSLDTINASPSIAAKKGIPSDLKTIVVLLNYVAMGYVFLYMLMLYYVTFYVTAPFYHQLFYNEAVPLYLHLCAWFMIINGLSNFVMMLLGGLKSVYCTPKDLPLYGDQTHPDWTKCSTCEVMVPPRTRHCNICNRCIIKRDHHCFFAGCCIGFYNQRYFICFCFSGIVGSSVPFYYMIQYLSANYVAFLGPEFFKYFLPYALVIFIIGRMSWHILFMLFACYLTMTSIFGCIYFLVWQVNIIVHGQTSYEFVKGRKLYKTSVSMHLQSIFGPLWFLNLIFPMPFLKNYGNGITWEVHNTKFL